MRSSRAAKPPSRIGLAAVSRDERILRMLAALGDGGIGVPPDLLVRTAE